MSPASAASANQSLGQQLLSPHLASGNSMFPSPAGTPHLLMDNRQRLLPCHALPYHSQQHQHHQHHPRCWNSGQHRCRSLNVSPVGTPVVPWATPAATPGNLSPCDGPTPQASPLASPSLVPASTRSAPVPRSSQAALALSLLRVQQSNRRRLMLLREFSMNTPESHAEACEELKDWCNDRRAYVPELAADLDLTLRTATERALLPGFSVEAALRIFNVVARYRALMLPLAAENCRLYTDCLLHQQSFSLSFGEHNIPLSYDDPLMSVHENPETPTENNDPSCSPTNPVPSGHSLLQSWNFSSGPAVPAESDLKSDPQSPSAASPTQSEMSLLEDQAPGTPGTFLGFLNAQCASVEGDMQQGSSGSQRPSSAGYNDNAMNYEAYVDLSAAKAMMTTTNAALLNSDTDVGMDMSVMN
ncbi:uncharacterized protein SPPG_02093 [Spizellomyces punctatus DAOM BR117]|uniref:ZMIZ1 N-terminal domain-containing protein n=1 Tax=Spizellomyces punctatus (strain DAOM BR117) TaxID=645134 RepID=A0A0L0HPK9_SPIPD|nr:uncharacterized protein SPPG_02093 [Spizellomyces punctatus DAOM BR117]KND03022.1 hypothetical protein SPPG_02093 [Spizellomyces punctatus DAOM BR117]|eukprot:XP_016611061.1 hypothetical protein SPPG_02093 [Spizellomyces punctatus DAOM BR117]